MKIPSSSLAFQVRLQWCALLLVLFVAAAPALHIHPLNLADATDQPQTPVSLSGSNWVGTLDPSLLPASVVQSGSPLPSLDGSALFGSAGGLAVGSAESASFATTASNSDYATTADTAQVAYTAGSSFNGFFGSYASDVSLPGDGTASFADGNVLIDSSGNFECSAIYVGGNPIATADGYLQTGAQSYAVGLLATPTGSIAIKDATGTVYLIPAIAQ